METSHCSLSHPRRAPMLVRLALMPLRPIFAVPVPVERGLPGSSKAADTSSSAC